MTRAARGNAIAWALVAPALCCVIGFVLAPILCLGIYSFWSQLGAGRRRHLIHARKLA